jgi:hypothetical protein
LEGGSGQLWLPIVTVESDTQVLAEGLVIQTSVRLESGSILEAVSLSAIGLVNGVRLEFHSETVQRLPTLDLGEIEGDYGIVPFTIDVSIGSLTPSTNIHALIVQGKPLSNCDEWKTKVTGLPKGFEATCEVIKGYCHSRRGNYPTIGLFIVSAKYSLSAGAIVGIVLACVLVLSVLGVVAWCILSRACLIEQSSPSSTAGP